MANLKKLNAELSKLTVGQLMIRFQTTLENLAEGYEEACAILTALKQKKRHHPFMNLDEFKFHEEISQGTLLAEAAIKVSVSKRDLLVELPDHMQLDMANGKPISLAKYVGGKLMMVSKTFEDMTRGEFDTAVDFIRKEYRSEKSQKNILKKNKKTPGASVGAGTAKSGISLEPCGTILYIRPNYVKPEELVDVLKRAGWTLKRT